ncbi:hypothetical protein PAXRUDRAFT_826626 [Paxillus rubicundulus Ve08.2h10]|uniref:Uncharacterized protein n=1 Tax=Paxillus rubicundulus Ve08.2h10 TaxID=930991 RepID=A0A0D0DRQ4_9AGAM|nr:hypothetical protein PAXRUDRAFT_826626 [Paxillus rubicundulus Ve08.2h10]
MFLGMGLVALPVTVSVYKQINAQRDLEEEGRHKEGRESLREAKFLGDQDPSFRYTI